MAATHVTIFNTTSSPVVVDGEGHTVAGGDWAAVNRRTDEVRQAIDSGRVVVVTQPEGDPSRLDPRARSAFEATDEANKPRSENRSEKQDKDKER